MQTNNQIILSWVMKIIVFFGFSMCYAQNLENTSWVRYDKLSSEYTPHKMEYFFYKEGKYVEKNTLKSGKILTFYEGSWSISSDTLYLFPEIVIGYSFESKIYFKDSIENNSEKYKIAFSFMKKRINFSRENEMFKIKMKWKKQKGFNDKLNFGAKIVEVEHIKTK